MTKLHFSFSHSDMMEPPVIAGSGEVTTSLDVSEEDTGTASDYSIAASGLKPKLDSIFTEVEQNLPEIDFDLSDVCICVYFIPLASSYIRGVTNKFESF